MSEKNKETEMPCSRHCVFPAGKAARVVALAALLLGGGAAPALAATWGADKNVTVSSGTKTVLYSGQKAGNLTIEGGAKLILNGADNAALIELTQGAGAGKLTIKGDLISNGSAIQGIAGASPWNYYGSADISGNLTLKNGGSVSLKNIAITDGTHSISGTYADPGYLNNRGAWRRGSMVFAGDSLSIGGKDANGNNTATVINLGNNGLIGAGSGDAGQTSALVEIKNGAVVNMNGGAGNVAPNAYESASIIRAAREPGSLVDAKVDLNTGGKINVNNFGVIAAPKVVVDGTGAASLAELSAINVATGATLEFLDNLKPSRDTQGASAMDSGLPTGTKMTGVDLTLKGGARLNTANGAFESGFINIAGANEALNLRSGIYGADSRDSGRYTFGNSGQGPTVNITDGGGIEGANIIINGGTYNLSGKHDRLQVPNTNGVDEAWRKGSLISAEDSLAINKAVVNLGDYAVLSSSGASTTPGSGFTINDSVVRINSSQDAPAIIRSFDPYSGISNAGGIIGLGTGASGTGNASLLVGEGKHGAIITSDLQVGDKGIVYIGNGGSLIIRRDARGASEVAAGDVGLTVDGTQLSIAGSVIVDGDMVVRKHLVNNAGIVLMQDGGNLFVSGDFDGSTGVLTADTPNIKANVTVLGTYKTNDADLNYAMSNANSGMTVGALELGASGGTPGELNISGSGKVTFLGIGADQPFFNGTDINIANGSTLNLGSDDPTLVSRGGIYEGQVTTAAVNALNVNAGSWTLSDLVVADAAGAVKVGDGKQLARLIISTENNTPGLTSATATPTATGRIVVNNLGTVQTPFAAVGVEVDQNTGKWGAKDGFAKFFAVGQGGTLAVDVTNANVKDADGKISLTNMAALREAITTPYDPLNPTLNGLLAVTGAVVAADTVTVAESAGLLLPDATLRGDSTDLGGPLNTGVKNIVVSDKSANDPVTIIAGDLRIVGSVGNELGQLVTGQDGGALNTTIDVKDNGSFTLGNTVGATLTSGTLTGNITNSTDDNLTNTHGGTVNAVNGTFVVTGDVNAGHTLGMVNVYNANLAVGGQLNANSVNVLGNSTLAANTVTLGGISPMLTVGGTDGRGIFTANSVNLGNGWLIADQQWTTGAYNPSMAAVGNLTRANVAVLANSQLTIGSSDPTWLSNQVRTLGGWGPNGITSALGVYKPYTMENGSALIVGGRSVTGTAIRAGAYPAPNTATFASGSLLAVNAPGLGGAAAITAPNAATSAAYIDSAAKLRVSGAKSGGTVKILSGFDTVDLQNGGWNNSNLTTDSSMLAARLNVGAQGVSVSITANKAEDIYPNLSPGLAGIVTGMYLDGKNDINSDDAGIRFLSRATNADMMPNRKQAAATIEGGAKIAVVGAVPAMTMQTSQAAVNAVAIRTSLADPRPDTGKAVTLRPSEDGVLIADTGLSAGDGFKNGLAVWMTPLYHNENVWNMKSGNFKTGYNGSFGGLAVGADYTFEKMARVGASFNIGQGYAQSSGDFNTTDNNFDFWGVNVYGGWTMENFGLSVDGGYNSNYNKLKQETPASMGTGNLKSDVTSQAWTIGAKGEYKIKTDAVDITPHVGVRYTALVTDEHKVKDGGTVYKVKRDEQDIWTFPVGVTLSKDLEVDGGWRVKPSLDLGILPAAGDLKSKTRARVPSLDGSANMNTPVVDDVTFDGGLGVEFFNDRISLGLNYNIQASEHRMSHGIYGMFKIDF